MSEEKKWACVDCTYENYQKSLKCTLCRRPRTPVFITDEVPDPVVQNIYSLASSESSEHQQQDSPALPHSLNPANKWTCQTCTYLNWPRSVKCIQCLNPRQQKPNVTSNKQPLSPPQSENEALSINVSFHQETDPKSASARNSENSPPHYSAPSPPATKHSNNSACSKRVPSSGSEGNNKSSSNSPESVKRSNNEQNKSIAATNVSAHKWACKACTYENWPRSIKCTLCGVHKGRSYTEGGSRSPPPLHHESGGNNSSTNSDNDAPSSTLKTNNKASKHRRSPPLTSTDIYQLGGATAASVDNGNESSNSTPNHSRRGGSSQKSLAVVKNNSSTGVVESNRLSDYTAHVSPRHSTSSTALKPHTGVGFARPLRSVAMRDSDWLWLNACLGVVEGDVTAVEAYVAGGGDPSRALTHDECTVLNRPSAFQVGYTLVHLAIRFQREDILTALLAATEAVKKAKKRVPSHVAPDLARGIIRDLSVGVRQRKGDFPCYFSTDMATFSLPADIEDFPLRVKKQLFSELLDEHAQKELEEEEPVINWSVEVTSRLGSRLYALWNRAAGDCLLDSVLQACYGVFDGDNTLRRVLADSLMEGANIFYPRWKECETLHAESMHFTLDESQWQQDWAILLSLASQPGSSLEHVHIFALAHILRRPIIVYGIKFVKSFRGENLGFARFQGVYLPLLWEQSFCWKTPIALGYTRGHFSALVPMEMDLNDCLGAGAGANLNQGGEEEQLAYLPLIDWEGKILPIHFLSASELGKEEQLLREWLECCVTDGGLLVARQKLHQKPPLVKQMLDDWLDRYRRMSQMVKAKQQHKQQSPRSSRSLASTAHGQAPGALSSEDDSDDE